MFASILAILAHAILPREMKTYDCMQELEIENSEELCFLDPQIGSDPQLQPNSIQLTVSSLMPQKSTWNICAYRFGLLRIVGKSRGMTKT